MREADHAPASVPLLIFDRMRGWGALADFLSSVGILVSASALESLARRHELPYEGGRIQGRPVWIHRTHLDAWIRHLRGVDLDVWLSQIARDQEAGLVPYRRGTKAGLSVVRSPLYVVTIRQTWTESVCREADGTAYASMREITAASWGIMPVVGPAAQWWLYRHCREATKADLHIAARRPKLHTPAKRLMGALEVQGTRAKWCRVPCSMLETPGQTTPCILAKAAPAFGDVVKYVESKYPTCVWLTWSRRIPIRPMELDDDNDRPVDQRITIPRSRRPIRRVQVP